MSGSQALFANLNHFSVRSIQISSCTIVFPSIVLAYFGQASYLRKHNQDASSAFYSSVPIIIASQLLISASFSIVQQSLALGCFPWVKVVHTSTKYKGQVYVLEINTLLMLACVGVTLGFKNTLKIGNAYVLYKFVDEGYLPLLFALTLVTIIYLWNYGYRKKYKYELENKVSTRKLVEVASNPSIHRVPGVALFYTELVHGISPIFTHYVVNVPALHSILVFVSIKYGYKDSRFECEFFKKMLVNQLKEFIRNDLLKPNELADNKEVEKVDEEMLQREALDLGTIMKLAFQSIGVVYGDLGISPLFDSFDLEADRFTTNEAPGSSQALD
ncbi:potassium transporter 5 [Quercus suber]|uniref:Potassium transporter 5 n=1 Tax=Quercus suber TaxID=58331 RepID=A0AAW0LGR6_QUESU